MRKARPLTFLIMAAALLVGCTGSQGYNASVTPSPGNAPVQSLVYSRSSLTINASGKYKGLRDLYVIDSKTEAIDLLKNKTYREVGAITNGVSGPIAETLDKFGNLYVANLGNGTISEYSPGQTTPSFAYSSGISLPFVVAVDAHGNVYEGDGDGFGTVNQYFQGVNSVLQSCSVGSAYVYGIAVDASNDVFVSFSGSGGPDKIAEYVSGLTGCNETVLPPTFADPAQMVMDKNKNLVVVDDGNQSIDVIAPPYTSVTSSFGSSVLHNPVSVTLSRDNKLAFVSDATLGEVFVFNYQTQAVVTTLGGGNGIAFPYEAVDGPNAVY